MIRSRMDVPGLLAPPPDGYVWRLDWRSSAYRTGWELRIVPRNPLKRLFAYMEISYDSERLGLNPEPSGVNAAANRLRARHGLEHSYVESGVYE